MVLAVRETPLTSIALSHMLALSREGVTIMPVCPPLYRRMESLDDVSAGFAAKLLMAIGIAPAHVDGWRAGELVAPEGVEE